MKKIFTGILSAVLAMGLCMTSSMAAEKRNVNFEESTASVTGALSENQLAILNAMKNEAQQRVDNAGKPPKAKDLDRYPDAGTDFPETFDLRSVDTDEDGVTENYVTSVKQQRPFGSCWAFATITAAETSILYDLGMESEIVKEDGSKADALDLSEHHLVWFTYTPIPDEDTFAQWNDCITRQAESQAGEGLYSQADGVMDNPSMKMSSGSTQFAAAKVFASGVGPVEEPDFDTAEEPESQILYRSKEGNITHNERFNVECYSPDDDWSIDEGLRFSQGYMLEDSYLLPTPVLFDEDGNYDVEYADRVGNLYKQQLMQGRAISTCFCSDTYRPDQEDKLPKYINSDAGTWAHYCYDNPRPNHAVTIIGWDDNYPSSNFLSEIQEADADGKPVYNGDGTPKMKSVPQPPANGAWIVKNSWGAGDSIGQGITESQWGVDGSGYFYLSYYDQSIEVAECFDFDVEDKLKSDLGQYCIDEYDFMPIETPKSVTTEFPVATANVFEAGEDEVLRAVSCMTTEPNEEVNIAVYMLDIQTTNLKDLKPVSEYTETFEYPGLHVVSLPQTVSVLKDQIYAICVCQKGRDGYLFSVGSDFNQKGFDAGYCDDRYAANGVVNPMESYIYLADDGIWWDFSELKTILESDEGAASYITYDNFPIKGYASLAQD